MDPFDDKTRRYNKAYVNLQRAYSSGATIEKSNQLYNLALVEYYKLLKLDFHWTGALESVLLLLSFLGYDEHCLGLIDFVLTRLEDHPNERIVHGSNNNNEVVLPFALGDETEEEGRLLEWVHGTVPKDRNHTFEDRLGVLNGQQWCTNAFLVPYLVVTMRWADINDDERMDYYLEHGAKLGKIIEQRCSDSGLKFLSGLDPDSRKEWGQDEARILLARPSSVVGGIREPDHWDTSCLLFWRILRDVVEDTDVSTSFQDTMYHIDKSFGTPVVVDEASCLMDLLSSENPEAGKLYCIHCRQHLSPPSNSDGNGTAHETMEQAPPAQRCSRCKVVHYCSRKCQKKNFALHKERCKNIHTLRSVSPSPPSPLPLPKPSPPSSLRPWESKQENSPTPTPKPESAITDSEKSRRYDLAYAIVDLAYLSTDTIDRGRQIYHLALVEYYQLLQLDFHWIGVLESVLLLLSILGYDDHLLALTDFVFYRLEHHPTEKISIRNNTAGKDDDHLLKWAQGNNPQERKNLVSDLKWTRLLKGKQWCANNFFVPLLLYAMRKQSSQRKEWEYSIYLEISSELGVAIERCASNMLPVMRAFSPHSRQRWRQDEASELLAPAYTKYPTMEDIYEHGVSGVGERPQDPDHWEESCLLFWDILKDAIAYTPNVQDALEVTIEAMDKHLKVSAVSEEPPDIAGFEAWGEAMREADRQGNLEQIVTEHFRNR